MPIFKNKRTTQCVMCEVFEHLHQFKKFEGWHEGNVQSNPIAKMVHQKVSLKKRRVQKRQAQT